MSTNDADVGENDKDDSIDHKSAALATNRKSQVHTFCRFQCGEAIKNFVLTQKLFSIAHYMHMHFYILKENINVTAKNFSTNLFTLFLCTK